MLNCPAGAEETKARPILKWAGGKQQLLPQLLAKVPDNYNKYIEPFFGGGAFFFALKPREAVISDSNPELMHVYEIVAQNVEDLIEILKTFKTDKDSYYEIRAQDPTKLSEVERAARTIYLNRTCFNGLYRVNKKGQFNVPYGDYKNPKICHPEELQAASKILKHSKILCGDYKEVLAKYAEEGDFIYLDPPYLPISRYSDFKRYTKEQFYEEDHMELSKEVIRLHERGCHVILTNSNHPLVYELYEGFNIEVFQTRRNINKDGKKRTGEDVIIYVPPRRKFLLRIEPPPLNKQVKKYPSTRYMGSKQNILPYLWQVASKFDFESILDLFSGSGVVSYMFKSYGKQVFSNDFMAMDATFACAMVENNQVKLSNDDVVRLLDRSVETDHLVSNRFKKLYFKDDENHLIDCIRTNIKKIKCKYKRAIAMTALIRAAMKKRPRGIFTYIGERYNDGRRDLKLSFQDQFIQAVKVVNQAVFNNGKENLSRQGDAITVHWKPDMVYMDPPYFSPFSDNDYVRRYHFVEGLACDWKGVEIQEHTKTKKFKSYPSPFSSRIGAHDAFDKLFNNFKDSILLISYSSNSLPTKEEMLSLMSKYKEHVEVISIDYRYSFANQGHKTANNNNKVKEYIFIGF
ncbi:MAG: Dam family site-specific DNA-(adenine-N6)-methyltransferase [Candidatus Aminicenantes bacterium]|nr:Dam family site-specific DNA-(adenine-N6)-methyltransferase [Candidatus Aminicenantes bacterium]NIM77900.1 Dam family site-specific DNA-(adenine-N6)-methyltransferase [Candidatus Aminicenantes bacterium]NIN17211.1 Dam family site-specific DNA-(adenine-N6)-methyltransferase [Candidatus Aminicenantes bacterium]NIN41104.1 Dam family site-specific DNA-(adenine-N6)-methyltransferase [Candidatus Aminicenantes bacterium]NIN83909.1 Dam family site-specific DNA-(adenine-N6)-methyltransferase [Candida